MASPGPGRKPGKGVISREPTIVPNGEAFRLATKWVEDMAAELDEGARRDLEAREAEAQQEWASLGILASPHQQQERGGREGPASSQEQRGLKSRPQRLGLGAKFLSHSQHSAGLQTLERRLKGKLKRDATEREFQEDPVVDEASEDDEESKAGSFKRRAEGNTGWHLSASASKKHIKR